MINNKTLRIIGKRSISYYDLPDDGRPLPEPIIITLEVVDDQASRVVDRRFVTVTVRNDEIHLAV